MSTCKGATTMNFIDFGIFLVNFWLPGGPCNALRDCWGSPVRRASEKVDLESFWGSFWSPFGDLFAILFLLWAPLGPLLRGFGSNVLAVLVAPGFGIVLRHQIYTKSVDFWVGKCG